MEAGAYDIDEDIADLHSSVKRLKHVSKAIQEETSLTQQIVETLENSLDMAKLTLKQTMKRLDRVSKKTRSNHVLYVLLFGLALFFCAYFWIKVRNFLRWIF
jgi:predicted RNase H-like nuclease (RuvC/YqgF family)